MSYEAVEMSIFGRGIWVRVYLWGLDSSVIRQFDSILILEDYIFASSPKIKKIIPGDHWQDAWTLILAKKFLINYFTKKWDSYALEYNAITIHITRNINKLLPPDVTNKIRGETNNNENISKQLTPDIKTFDEIPDESEYFKA
ncbi:hypothetical protein H8356DRAFT_1350876 [Neocallimastix lanati (nom. inval.)]|nr:hypothetical protein H8356DRAFT_1350876 [Neocallimastix sp. JGI-2020a]